MIEQSLSFRSYAKLIFGTRFYKCEKIEDEVNFFCVKRSKILSRFKNQGYGESNSKVSFSTFLCHVREGKMTGVCKMTIASLKKKVE